MTITATHHLSAGSVILPAAWRRAHDVGAQCRVECAAYRGALTIWPGEPYDGSVPLRARANGGVYVPRDVREALGWRDRESVDVEWDEDDDTLVLRKAEAEGVA